MKCEAYYLGDVCTFIDYRGKTPPKTTKGIPLVTAKIVKNGMIQEPQEFIAENYYDEWMRRITLRYWKTEISGYPTLTIGELK